jgi:glyoxylase-like metal-dependent hydrolase (beta-lactamase superfamily II)
MSTERPQYEVLTLRYATLAERTAHQNFTLLDMHDGPMPLDFYVWAIRGAGRTIVVDTGFSLATAQKRKRMLLRTPADALSQVGIDAATVSDVVITHLDWDHSGNTASFPQAVFHVQDGEMAFATGRNITHKIFRRRAEVDDVLAMVRLLYDGRLRFHNGIGTIAPGVEVHLLGGHTGGLQIVRVHTARGWVVLASDAAHYWINLTEDNPFPGLLDLGKVLDGFRALGRLADGPEHIIPGHDPLVLSRFQRLKGLPDVVRVDLPPLA